MGPDVLDSVHRVLGGQAVLTCTTTNTHTQQHNLLVNDRCLQQEEEEGEDVKTMTPTLFSTGVDLHHDL